MEHSLEPGAFDEKREIHIVPAAQEGLGVGLALGQDHIGGVHGPLGVLPQQVQMGARHLVSVVDDREGNAHGGGILPEGIVQSGAAPDAEGDLQVGILLLNFLRKDPVKADLAGVVRQVQEGPGSFLPENC